MDTDWYDLVILYLLRHIKHCYDTKVKLYASGESILFALGMPLNGQTFRMKHFVTAFNWLSQHLTYNYTLLNIFATQCADNQPCWHVPFYWLYCRGSAALIWCHQLPAQPTYPIRWYRHWVVHYGRMLNVCPFASISTKRIEGKYDICLDRIWILLLLV